MKNPRVTNLDDIRIPAPCGHRGCAMKEIEVRAQEDAAVVLADPDLTRVCDQDPLYAGGRRSPDFRSPQHVVEVKELTSQPLRGFNGAYDRLDRHTPISDFEHLWAVSVEVSAAAALYDGDPELPQLKTLIETLTPMIKDLERRKITDLIHDHDNFGRWAKVIGFYGDCAVLTGTKLEPGILLTGTISGQPRTTDLDYDVVAPLQTWLDSRRVKNAQKSLAGHPEVHVLVLMASPNGPASGLIHTLLQTPGEVPAAALRLPDGIDVLIVATNTDVLRFAPVDGWHRHSTPSLR